MSVKIEAMMPGLVNEVSVKAGDQVQEGDVLLIMESMKMHVSVESTHAGTIESIAVQEDDEVAEGDVLVSLTVD